MAVSITMVRIRQDHAVTLIKKSFDKFGKSDECIIYFVDTDGVISADYYPADANLNDLPPVPSQTAYQNPKSDK